MESIPQLRISLDPDLERLHAPAIHWVWRLIFATCGWAWQEVSPGEPCDVAWVARLEDAPTAKLLVLADPSAWPQPSRFRLESLHCPNGSSLVFPLYQGQAAPQDVVSIEDGKVVCRRDVIFDAFWLATGQEERYFPREKHGFYQLEATVFHRERVAHRALVSQIIHWFEEMLIQLGYPAPIARWPAGKKAALAAGHDVDYPEVYRLLEPVRKMAAMGSRGIRPAFDLLTGRRTHWQFHNWVDLEKSLGLRSAFYFVARKGSLLEYATGLPDTFYDVTSPKFRRLFQYLHDEGFEVGLHASYLAYQDFAKFKREKEILEESSQGPVNGNRHHYWHMNPDDPEETLGMHEKLGLEYDASVIHDHYLGWRRSISHPYFPFHQHEQRELKTLQLPTGWMDDQLFRYLKYNQDGTGRVETLIHLTDRVLEQGGCFTLDIHDYVYDDCLFPEWRKTYQQLLVHLHQQGDFWFNTPLEIARHWTGRCRKIQQASRGLDRGLSR